MILNSDLFLLIYTIKFFPRNYEWNIHSFMVSEHPSSPLLHLSLVNFKPWLPQSKTLSHCMAFFAKQPLLSAFIADFLPNQPSLWRAWIFGVILNIPAVTTVSIISNVTSNPTAAAFDSSSNGSNGELRIWILPIALMGRIIYNGRILPNVKIFLKGQRNYAIWMALVPV